MMEVSVVLPVYNEEAIILNVLQEVESAMKKTSAAYEIIVVNDGSTDNSKEIIEKSGIKTKLYEHCIRKGYGRALKTGIKNSLYDLLVVADADGTYPYHKIPELISGMQDADMVVGARIGKDAKIPLIRRLGKWPINRVAHYLTSSEIPDLNSGLRVMKKEIVNKFINILPDGFSFTATITLAMLTNDYRLKFIPIPYNKRTGKSKIQPVFQALNFIQLIIRTVLYFNPLKVFIPLSIFLVILAFFVLFASWLLFGRAMDVSFGVILMTAVIVMAIGMLADLINKRVR